MMRKDDVILVDSDNNVVGIMDKMEAHKKGLLHRAISVFIVDSGGRWLLQKRASDKYHSSSLWTNTCCSHPFPSESNSDAANRRLSEEMGIRCSLRELFHFSYKEALDNDLTEHEIDHVFFGICDDAPSINHNEVMDYKYITYTDLQEDIASNPQNYTVWFKMIVERVQNQKEQLNTFK